MKNKLRPPIPFFASDQNLQIISALSDKTRAEILAILFDNSEGLTAAKISRIVNKKIPSTIHQLEILYTAGLITSQMKLVSSIGRKIKHWILLPDNYRLRLHLDLQYIIQEHFFPMKARLIYLSLLSEVHYPLQIENIEHFDYKILAIALEKFNIQEKDIEKFLSKLKRMLSIPILLGALIHKTRQLIGNGIELIFLPQIIGISTELAHILLEEMEKRNDEFILDRKNSIISLVPY